jgi:hypothetical protein
LEILWEESGQKWADEKEILEITKKEITKDNHTVKRERYQSIIGPKVFIEEKKSINKENEVSEKKNDLYHNNLYRAKRKKNKVNKKQKIDKNLIPYSGKII